MEELFYWPQDIAWIIRSQNLDIQERFCFIDFIWEQERAYLAAECRYNKRKFVMSIQHWISYLNHQMDYKTEIPKVNQDLACIGSDFELADNGCFQEVNMFFKSLRLRILYFENRGYVTMKFRTLLQKYGYKRRSGKIIGYFKKYLDIYHIQTCLCNNVECNLEEIDLNDRIIFRVIGTLGKIQNDSEVGKPWCGDTFPNLVMGQKAIIVSLGREEQKIMLSGSRLEDGVIFVILESRSFLISLISGEIMER